MLAWILDFQTDRHIHVRVGTTLFDLFRMENGYPQRMVIIPVLFNIMMNDILEPQNNVKLSFNADDSAIWRAGPNPNANQRYLQSYLVKLKTFFDEWGVMVSTSKFVAIESHRWGTPAAHRPLRLGTLRYDNTVKFVGVTFYRFLTWSYHIKFVADRCRKRLNLMRSITGSLSGGRRNIPS